MSERVAQWMLAAILIFFVGLGLAYAYVTPTLEAPDEILHYDYVRSLVNTGSPPARKEDEKSFSNHAPLYYAVGALGSFWVGENDLELWPARHNPYFGYRFGDVGRDNKNLYLHPADDRFGASDTWLGVRVVRALSVLIGAATIWVIYRIGREVFPHRPEIAVGVAGLAAFIPEFLFVSAAVNDDNGASLFGALALWAMVRILKDGASSRRCAGLGLALGLGWLSKLTVMALVPTAVLTLALVALRDRSWCDTFRWAIVVFGIAALLIAPWVVRQVILHGDPIGLSQEREGFGDPGRPISLADLWPDLYWLRTSFWGRFGYNQIPLSKWIYDLLDIVTLIALLGLVRLAIRYRRASLLATQQSQIAVLAAAFIFTLGPMIVRRFLRPMPSFGRYLFPVLPAIAVIMFTGLSAWIRRRVVLATGVTVAMLVLGVAGLVFFLAPAYARPPIYDASSAPEPTYHLGWVYLQDDRPLARLRGYDLSRKAAEPGETMRVTLYWETLEETGENYVLFAQLFGQQGAKVGQRDTYPGLGHYPTSFWQTGQIIADGVVIRVNPDAVAPSRLRLDVGLYQPGQGRLAVVDETGNPVGAATAGWLKLIPTEEVAPPATATDYRLGDAIALVGYDLDTGDSGLHLTLYWASLAPMERDYTVFVHLIGPDGTAAAQADGPPIGGDYPTSFWSPNEIVTDERLIPTAGLPPATYHLSMGMYVLESGERLPATDADGARLLDDVVPLTEVELP